MMEHGQNGRVIFLGAEWWIFRSVPSGVFILRYPNTEITISYVDLTEKFLSCHRMIWGTYTKHLSRTLDSIFGKSSTLTLSLYIYLYNVECYSIKYTDSRPHAFNGASLYLSSKLDIIAISFTQNTSTNHFLSLCHVVGIANSSITSDSAGTNAGFCRINFQWVLLFRKDTLHSPPLAISWRPWFSLGKTWM